MATWDFNDEQANFNDVLDLAHTSGPQLIKRGSQRLYVVSAEEWQRAKECLTQMTETSHTGSNHADIHEVESRGMGARPPDSRDWGKTG